MTYSTKLLDHYENPRNVGTLDKSDPSVGTGLVGAPACGDVMKLQIRVGADGLIADARSGQLGGRSQAVYVWRRLLADRAEVVQTSATSLAGDLAAIL